MKFGFADTLWKSESRTLISILANCNLSTNTHIYIYICIIFIQNSNYVCFFLNGKSIISNWKKQDGRQKRVKMGANLEFSKESKATDNQKSRIDIRIAPKSHGVRTQRHEQTQWIPSPSCGLIPTVVAGVTLNFALH